MAKKKLDNTPVSRPTLTPAQWGQLFGNHFHEAVDSGVVVALTHAEYHALTMKISDLQFRLNNAEDALKSATTNAEYNTREFNTEVRNLKHRLSQLSVICHTMIQTIGTTPIQTQVKLEQQLRDAGYFSPTR